MKQQHYDAVVIGTGPGGEGAAMQAVKLGKRVAVIERSDEIGGGCTHSGTIPSKALRHAIFQVTHLAGSPLLRDLRQQIPMSFPELRRSAGRVIEKQVRMRQGFYDRNGVPIIRGEGRFLDAHTLQVQQPNGAHQELTANHIVLAPGSRPYRPPDVDFEHCRVYDSDTILGLETTPRSITICGAGVVGCEYASMFRNLDVKVNLVNSRDQLLSFLDDEIIDALSYHLRDRGVIIRQNEMYERIECRDDNVVAHLQSGKELKTDVLLMAIGRSGNTDSLDLGQVGLEPDSRGQLQVNEHFQTEVPHIYAVGDVIGFPSLASAAYVQGRYAGMHLVTGEADRSMVQQIPTGIYTSPEISSIGRTERELTEEKVPYEVGQAMFKNLARAQITGQTTGMLKLLFHRETLEILGIHCFGANASEIIHIGQAIMLQDGPANTLMYFINTTFNYPTMAEAYRVAALNGWNRIS